MLNDLKEVEKFLKLCRKQGVTDITFQGISVKFGDLPAKSSAVEDESEIATDELSPDEMIFYAVQGQA